MKPASSCVTNPAGVPKGLPTLLPWWTGIPFAFKRRHLARSRRVAQCTFAGTGSQGLLLQLCAELGLPFSALPEGVNWNQLPVEFLAVSDPVAHFIKEATHLDAPVIRPGIDRSIFHAPEKKKSGTITVAYMPRKNKAAAAQIKSIFEHRVGTDIIRWRPIDGLDAFGVAQALRSSHIFLMTGFPEGCPLPSA